MNQRFNNKNKRHKSLQLLGLMLIAIIISLTVAACGNNVTATATRGAATSSATTAATSESAASSPGATIAATATTGRANSAITNTAAPATTALATVVPASTPMPRLSADQVESNSVVSVVKAVNPAVVTVYNRAKVTTIPTRTQTTPLPDSNSNGQTQGIGTGVIISNDGYIVTNAHVVEGEDSLAVAFNDGKQIVPAKLIGADTLGDIAVLKVDVAVPAVAKFGDSSKLELGETTIAIGAALGNFRNSVSKGVVSGLNRTIPSDTSSSIYIQTDAPINSGNSGGPLLNLKGEVIGINTAVVRNDSASTLGRGSASAEGLGFAIPSNTVKILTEQLMSKGAVSRPYFGISYQMITPAIAGTQRGTVSVPSVEGAWINGTTTNPAIVAGGPADKAGLKNNDVITAIDGIPLNDNNPLANLTLNYKPGDTVKLTVQRGDQTLTLDLTLVERPKNLTR